MTATATGGGEQNMTQFKSLTVGTHFTLHGRTYIKSYPTRARDAITGSLVHIYPNEQVTPNQPKEALL